MCIFSLYALNVYVITPLKTFSSCVTEKKMHSLKVESYVLFGGQIWELKPGIQHLR